MAEQLANQEGTSVAKMTVFIAARSPHGWNNGSRPSLRLCVVNEENETLICHAHSKMLDPKLKTGHTVILRDTLAREEALHITARTTVFRAPKLAVTEEKVEEAKAKLLAPKNPEVQLEVVKSSPVKRKLTVRGTVSTMEELREVTVKGRKVPVRDCTLSGPAAKVRLILWEASTGHQLSTGQQVIVKDASVNYNTFHKENTLTINVMESLEVLESQQPTLQDYTIIGVLKDEWDGELTILIEEQDKVVKVNASQLNNHLDKDISNVDQLLDILPVTITCYDNDDVLTF